MSDFVKFDKKPILKLFKFLFVDNLEHVPNSCCIEFNLHVKILNKAVDFSAPH